MPNFERLKQPARWKSSTSSTGRAIVPWANIAPCRNQEARFGVTLSNSVSEYRAHDNSRSPDIERSSA